MYTISADGNWDGVLKCGTVPDVFATVDFGVTSSKSVNDSFAVQKHYNPKGYCGYFWILGGPAVNSEFYPGWLVLWGQRTGDHNAPAGIIRTTKVGQY